MGRKIISLCAQADEIAIQFYEKLSNTVDDAKVRSFYSELMEEERTHLAYWRDLDRYAEKGILPEIFDSPRQVEEELSTVVRQAEALLKAADSKVTTSKAFYLTYKLEFYLLHPAFEALFRFAKFATEEYDFSERYKDHIHKIVEALHRYGKVTPEMELVGETLLRLWQENKRLSAQVVTDELTGVFNRRGFFKAILPLSYLAQRSGSSVALFMIDIDDFKSVNDRHGHLKGDEVLARVARSIGQHIRTSDVLGRFGGEEFIVFLPEVDRSFILPLAEKIRMEIQQSDVDSVSVTASIGASAGHLGENIERDIDALIGEADDNLYRAKRGGKDRVCYP